MGLLTANAEKLETQLKQWDTKLKKLESRTEKAGSEAKLEAQANLDKSIRELRAKYKVAQNKLADFKTAGEGKWDHFKSDIETLWGDIEVTFKGLTHN